MAAAVVHKGFDVVREVGVKCLAACLHPRGSGSDSQRFRLNAVAIEDEPSHIGFCDPCSAVPQPPAEVCDWSLEQHPLARKSVSPNEPLHGGLDMPDAHGDVPPVENMFYIAADGISTEVRECRLAVRDHCQQTAWPPPKGRQFVTHMVVWQRRCIDDQTKSSAHMPVFDLAYHKIQMSLLIFRSATDMRAVHEYCRTTFGNRVSEITRRSACLLKPLRNPAQPVPDRHVMRWVAYSSRFHCVVFT